MAADTRGGRGGRTRRSVALKGARWALWRNPDTLTEDQRSTLAFIQITNKPLVQGIFAQGAVPGDLLRRRAGRQAAAGRVATMGRSLSHPRVHRTGQANTTPSARHPRDPRQWTVQRSDRGEQYPPAGSDPSRLWLPLRRGAHRDGDATPRWPLPIPARPRRSGVAETAGLRPTPRPSLEDLPGRRRGRTRNLGRPQGTSLAPLGRYATPCQRPRTTVRSRPPDREDPRQRRTAHMTHKIGSRSTIP